MKFVILIVLAGLIAVTIHAGKKTGESFGLVMFLGGLVALFLAVTLEFPS